MKNTDKSTPNKLSEDDAEGIGEAKDTTTLRAQVSRLQDVNEQLHDRLAAIEDQVAAGAVDGADWSADSDGEIERPTSGSSGDDTGLVPGSLSKTTRRGVLAGLATLGLIGAGTGTASAETSFGDSASGSNSNGFALQLENKASSGPAFGLKSFTDSSSGRAVLGRARSNTGNAWGVLGISESTKGRGLQGFATHPTGANFGLKGRSDSTNGHGIWGHAFNSSGSNLGVRGTSDSESGTGVLGEATNSSGTIYGVRGETNSPDGYGVYTPDNAKVDGTMQIGGDVQVSGVKNFVETVSTDTGPKQVKYTSVEAGDTQTEHSDVTEMEDGVALVDLPDHYGMVTSSEERLIVQVTPYADEKVHPQVTDRSIDRIVVKDFGDGPDNYKFSYTVKGIRRGFEDQEIVSEPW